MPRPSLPATIALAGSVALLLAGVLAPHTAVVAAAAAWPPFVLVAGLLLIGFAAHHEGLFDVLAAGLDRLPGGTTVLYVAALSLVAAVTVVLNLDTSVAFLTPILVLVARRRGAAEAPFLYGCVFMSNAASLLLPGSNLTNLLVLATDPVPGGVFAARMAPGWLAAVVVTGLVTALVLRRRGEPGTAPPRASARRRPWLSLGATAVAAVAILALPQPALVVVALGVVVMLVEVLGGLRAGAALRAVDLRTLAGLLGIAIGLGTLARSWAGPAELLAGAGRLETAVLGVVAAVLVNNLPAAVLLGSRHPAHARDLLLGLNLGPNLAATGSLSAVLWWTAARRVQARPSLRTYSLVGALVVPLSLAAALLADGLLAPGGL